jgi:hypothetical protein
MSLYINLCSASRQTYQRTDLKSSIYSPYGKLLDCYLTATGQWFSPGTPDSSINKADHQDIAEKLLKVALNTTIPNPT